MRVKVFISLFLTAALFVATPPVPAEANILEDIVNKIKDSVEKQVVQDEQKKVKIESSIDLYEEGDLNNNGQIDTGDTIQFTYKINNETKKDYKFTRLETNIDPQLISKVSNIYGTASLNQDRKTIIIPNLLVRSGQEHTIQFTADEGMVLCGSIT